MQMVQASWISMKLCSCASASDKRKQTLRSPKHCSRWIRTAACRPMQTSLLRGGSTTAGARFPSQMSSWTLLTWQADERHHEAIPFTQHKIFKSMMKSAGSSCTKTYREALSVMSSASNPRLVEAGSQETSDWVQKWLSTIMSMSPGQTDASFRTNRKNCCCTVANVQSPKVQIGAVCSHKKKAKMKNRRRQQMMMTRQHPMMAPWRKSMSSLTSSWATMSWQRTAARCQVSPREVPLER